MSEHHDERQDQPLAQDLAEAITSLILCAHNDVRSDAFHGFPNDLCFLREDGGREGFGEEEERSDLYQDREDRCSEEDPAPVCTGRDVRAAYRSDARRDPGQHAVDSLALSALLFAPGIS